MAEQEASHDHLSEVPTPDLMHDKGICDALKYTFAYGPDHLEIGMGLLCPDCREKMIAPMPAPSDRMVDLNRQMTRRYIERRLAGLSREPIR